MEVNLNLNLAPFAMNFVPFRKQSVTCRFFQRMQSIIRQRVRRLKRIVGRENI
ncbi:hypothetical protein CHCC14559_3376 [Bacillus licheniformis]|nr:hypothetical protein CHCC14559_3376 [Bacillus licheniformis]